MSRIGGAVAARLLGVVHRQVGLGEQLLGAAGLVADQVAMPMLAVTRDAADPRSADVARGSPRSSSAATVRALALVGLGEQHRELVAAEAGEHVGLAQAAAQQLGDAAQELVAGAVAERVVDVLEVVEVEHQDGAAGAVALRVGDLGGRAPPRSGGG